VKAAFDRRLVHFLKISHSGMVLCGVILCRRFRMVSGMGVVAVGNVGVVARRLLVAASLVLSRFSVMAGCMFMVLRRFLVVFCAFFTHREGI
jgi:hypothetical protein